MHYLNGISHSRHANRCSGFTLIELLVVIALISALVGFLLPAIQAVREADAAMEAETNLNVLAGAATAYHTQIGEFPAGLQQLSDFCSQNPTLCTLDAGLATGNTKGSTYYGTSNGGVWKAQVEPDVPGLTGSLSLVMEVSRMSDGSFVRTLTRHPTPGADKARSEAFARIESEGAQTVSELFELHPNATIEARSFVEMPATRDQVLGLLDRNADGIISLLELYDFPGGFASSFDGIDPQLEEPLRAFLNKASQELKLHTMNQQMAVDSNIGVGVLRSMDGGKTWFTLEGLCNLINLYVSDEKVASDLCKKLRLAAAAKERGDVRGENRLISDVISFEVEQVHKTLTIRNATTLVWLTVGFFEVTHPQVDGGRLLSPGFKGSKKN